MVEGSIGWAEIGCSTAALTKKLAQHHASKKARFVGLGNFRALAEDRVFWRAVWNTFLVVNAVVYGELLLGLGLQFGTLRGQRSGQVVIMASQAGLIATARMGFYNATKHALVGLARTLMLELAGTGVRCALICPGVARTGFQQRADDAKYARSTRLSACTPEQVAAATLRAIERRTHGEVLVPGYVRALVAAAAVAPRLQRVERDALAVPQPLHQLAVIDRPPAERGFGHAGAPAIVRNLGDELVVLHGDDGVGNWRAMSLPNILSPPMKWPDRVFSGRKTHRRPKRAVCCCHAPPHTSRATSTTNFSFAHCSSSVRMLPSSVEAKPHCGDSASCPSGARS